MYGVLMVVKGSVKIEDSSKKVIDGKIGAKVLEGNTVTTGADSRAKIVMSDRNVLNVNPDTVLIIAKYENDAASGKKNVELNLLKGKVRNNVEQTYDGEKSRFLIKTPTAVAGVRGTQFLASYDIKTQMSSVVTFKGAVTFSSVNAQGAPIGNPVTIKKGEMTQAAPNAPPEPPKTVPKEEMKRMDGESSTGAASDKKRETASEEPKKDSKKDDKKDDKKESKDGREPANSSNEKGPKEKAPPPPSMMDPTDMNPDMGKTIKDPMGPPSATPPPPPPTMATPNPLVKDIIRDGTGKARVNVNPVKPN
jgi:hypothetical protein